MPQFCAQEVTNVNQETLGVAARSGQPATASGSARPEDMRMHDEMFWGEEASPYPEEPHYPEEQCGQEQVHAQEPAPYDEGSMDWYWGDGQGDY